MKPNVGQIRIREWNDWWYAERWDGRYWSHIYCVPSKENLQHWLDFIQPVDKNVDTSASD